MIEYIKLENYRCFEKTRVKLKNNVVIAGKNNSGKSTIIEALRMVAYACRKSVQTIYKEAPYEMEISGREKGIKIDVDSLKIDLRGVVYFYRGSFAFIEAGLKNGCKIKIKINNEYAFALLYDSEGNNIKYKSKAIENQLDNIQILPQIGLIKESEKILVKATIERDKDTYLSSRHFRNELLLHKDKYWKNFKMIAEDTWSGLKLKEVNYDVFSSEYIRFMVQESGFVAEVGLMGSGLQMWLQIMWFLCRTEGCQTVILDEPDVYMHPDLQRKLYNLIIRRYPQIIIATHSVEILSETSPENVLMLDKKDRQMKYANDLKAVQAVIDNMGGIQNLSILRLSTAKKCLFVEGKDLKLLIKIAKKIGDGAERLGMIPTVSINGFCNWEETLGTAKLFENETGGQIKCFCILDSDYYQETSLIKIKARAAENGLNLHIWKRKEIENYFIIPRAIYRMVEKQFDSFEIFCNEFEALLDTEKDDIIDEISSQVHHSNRDWEISTCNKIAREMVNAQWNSVESKINLVSGKKFIKKINNWLNEKHGISSTFEKIYSHIKPNEFCDEVKNVIEELVW